MSLSIKPKVHLTLLVLTACSTISYLHLPISCFETAKFLYQFSSVQSLSCDWLFATPWIAAHQASLSITNSWSSLKLMLSRWCHPAISSSVILVSSCPQSLPASGSFPMSQLFAWGGQSTGVSALASVLPMNTQDWSLLVVKSREQNVRMGDFLFLYKLLHRLTFLHYNEFFKNLPLFSYKRTNTKCWKF